jgi:two-component system chemotaxis sensor kinase CheA
MESELYKFKKNIQSKCIEDLQTFICQFEMCKWLDADMQILHTALGEQFISKDKIIIIEESRLLEIEEKVSSLLPIEESSLVRRDIRRLRYKNFSELLAPYVEYTKNLSEKLMKTVNDLEIEGGNIHVDTDKYNPFIKSLTHVFRNCVDHGIEHAEDRIKSNKDEAGNIYCKVDIKDNLIHLTISDDGSGIDIEKIKKKAVEKGIFNEWQVESLRNEEVIELIFIDDFSTSKDISEFSGRGFGLSAVKQEVDRLGGSIHVETEREAGTTFRFVIPLMEG